MGKNRFDDRSKKGKKKDHVSSDLSDIEGEVAHDVIDLNRRKLALEMEKELGGVFGIGIQDIEKALERLFSGEIPINDPSQVDLPQDIQAVMRHLDAILSIAERNIVEKEGESISAMLELFLNYSDRLSILVEKHKGEDG